MKPFKKQMGYKTQGGGGGGGGDVSEEGRPCLAHVWSLSKKNVLFASPGKNSATALCWSSTSTSSHSLTQSSFFDQVSIPLEPVPYPIVGYRQCWWASTIQEMLTDGQKTVHIPITHGGSSQEPTTPKATLRSSYSVL